MGTGNDATQPTTTPATTAAPASLDFSAIPGHLDHGTNATIGPDTSKERNAAAAQDIATSGLRHPLDTAGRALDAISRFTEPIENYTQEGRAAHPVLSKIGDVTRGVREELTGGQSVGKPLGTSEGVLNNPLIGLIVGPEGTAEDMETAAKLVKTYGAKGLDHLLETGKVAYTAGRDELLSAMNAKAPIGSSEAGSIKLGNPRPNFQDIPGHETIEPVAKDTPHTRQTVTIDPQVFIDKVSRGKINTDQVNRYRQMIRNGEEIKPAMIHYDEHGEIVDVDGRHRGLAHMQEGAPLKVEVIRDLPREEAATEAAAETPKTEETPSWAPHKLELQTKVPQEPGYVYHATNEENAHDIANSGKLETHKPDYGTDQYSWPDGSAEKRSYFTPKADTAKYFAPEEGKSVLLRMKHDSGTHFPETGTGDLYATKNIKSNQLEVLGDDQKWHSINELKTPTAENANESTTEANEPTKPKETLDPYAISNGNSIVTPEGKFVHFHGQPHPDDVSDDAIKTQVAFENGQHVMRVTLPNKELTRPQIDALKRGTEKAVGKNGKVMVETADGVKSSTKDGATADHLESMLSEIGAHPDDLWYNKAAQISKKHSAGGIDPRSGKMDNKGIGVEIHPEARKPLDHDPTEKDFQQFYQENKHLFDTHPEYKIGWDNNSSVDGGHELNIGVVGPGAATVGKKLDQRAVWDIDGGEEIPTGGTGTATSFPDYPVSERIKDLLSGGGQKQIPKIAKGSTDEFLSAVQNTVGAKMDGKRLTVQAERYQKPEQEGQYSVRTGVFYSPEPNSHFSRYYKAGKMGYGGTQKIEGPITFENPIVAKGPSGGSVPKYAYDSIKGSGSYEKMRDYVLKYVPLTGSGVNDADREERVAQVLEKFGADPAAAYDIIHYSRSGNQLPYAIQENIVAHAVRAAGHDGIIGYSKHKGQPRLSEVFHLTQDRYPSPEDNIAPTKSNGSRKTAGVLGLIGLISGYTLQHQNEQEK